MSLFDDRSDNGPNPPNNIQIALAKQNNNIDAKKMKFIPHYYKNEEKYLYLLEFFPKNE